MSRDSDTHPQGGDAQQAPFMGSAVAESQSPITPDPSIQGNTSPNDLADELFACPDIMHARIVAPGQRVAEVVIPVDLRDRILTTLRSSIPAPIAEDEVERVAEALWVESGNVKMLGPWRDYQDSEQPSVLDVYRRHARAAMSAMPAAIRTTPGDAWQTIESAPKDGTPILVFFNTSWLGVVQVRWDSPHEHDVTPENGIWCVDDNKHGPYPVRGYSDGDDTHWRPLPTPPTSTGDKA